jgi:hypothetical protein
VHRTDCWLRSRSADVSPETTAVETGECWRRCVGPRTQPHWKDAASDVQRLGRSPLQSCGRRRIGCTCFVPAPGLSIVSRRLSPSSSRNHSRIRRSWQTDSRRLHIPRYRSVYVGGVASQVGFALRARQICLLDDFVDRCPRSLMGFIVSGSDCASSLGLSFFSVLGVGLGFVRCRLAPAEG